MINNFANPQYFWLLLLIPFWFYYEFYRKQEPSFYFSQVNLLKDLKVKNNQWLKYLLLFLRVLVFVILVLALSRPQNVSQQKEIYRKGVDIIIACDVSGSMAAEDLQVNRLHSAKKVIQEFILKRENDRLGLVSFGSYAVSKVPLTFDHTMLVNVVDRLKIGEAGDGTAIGEALVNGLNRLRDSEAKSKLIILVTDGENNSGSIGPLEAAELAKKLGIKIYTIGIGSPEGTPLPYMHPQLGKQYLRNPNGSLALTKLNSADLIKIADLTNARYFQVGSTVRLSEVFSEIDKLEKVKLKTDVTYQYQERFGLFLVLGLLLLLGELFLSKTIFRSVPCI